jgi:3-oxoacyl-[acyl-carrier protein] reductase
VFLGSAESPWGLSVKRTVLITGASSGIGRACASAFADAGYCVVAVGRNKAALDAAVAATRPETTGSWGIQADITTPEGLSRIFDDTRLDHLDCLVNAAGVGQVSPIDRLTLEEWNNVMHLNVTVPFQMIQRALPMLKRGTAPSVVNVSSIAGRLRSLSLGAHYTTSKAALIGLTRHLAAELGPLGIRVNATCPSQTKTPLLDDALTPAQQASLAMQIPLRRLATADEQAAVIRFLCSPEAGYITGAIIDVNGGQL